MLNMLNGIFKVHGGVIAGFVAVVLLYIAGPAQADLQSGRIDLLTDFNVRIDGAKGAAGGHQGDYAGFSVAGAGDVNGDDYDDVIVGAPLASHPLDPSGMSTRWIQSGSAYIVFGKPGSGTPPYTLDLLFSIGWPGSHEGILITGVAEGDNAGFSVAGAGDVNGDGLDDVIVGAPFAWSRPYPDRRSTGAAYVVFGKRDTDTVSLATVAASDNGAGFLMYGVVDGSTMAGQSVAGAGDVNGDDYDDVIVGAPGANFNPGEIGSAYVVKGKRDTDTVALANVGTSGNTEGFRIDGESVGVSAGLGTLGAGFSVAGAGDVNGDDYDDVIVGAPSVDNGVIFDVGIANVVYGKRGHETVALADVGSPGNGEGYRIIGARAGDMAGWSVDGAGDVNGDGIPDLIVGAPYADYPNSTDSGSAYVVLGKETVDAPVELASIGSPGNGAGFRIDGPLKNYRAGLSVAGAGDVNGDGTPDLLVGTPYTYSTSSNDQVSLPGPEAGIAYLVHGKAEDTSTVDLTDVGSPGNGNSEGVLIAGAAAGDYAGYSVAAAGDFNGDRGADVIVGAPAADNDVRIDAVTVTRTDSGSAYVIYGVPPVDTVDPNPPKAAGQPESCAKVLYENRLEVPREARLADLVRGRGLKVKASASEESSGTVKVEITGRQARYFKLFRKRSRAKSKEIAGAKVRVGKKPEDVYLVAKGKARKLIKRALRLKRAPKRTKLKVSLLSHSVEKKSLGRLNTQTVRALRRGKVKRTDTYTKVRQVVDRSLCGKPLVAKIKGPRQTKLTALTTRKGKKGRGVEVKVTCSEDCTATVGARLWGRYEIGLMFRKIGQKSRLVSSRSVHLQGGESRTLRLGSVASKRLRKLLVRGAKWARYDRVKLKYFIEAHTADGVSDDGAGTSRVLLRFR